MNWLLKKVTSTALQAFSKDYENTRPIPNSIWSISEKKGKAVDMIAYFSTSFTKNSKEQLLAKRAIKFHKTFCTIPVFLKLLSAEESDTSASYETEYANPLSSQIGKLSFSEVIWGLYQIMNGLTYLDNRSLLNLSSETIFVTSNGDWKFGVLEFLADEQESISISDSFTQCIPQAQIGYFLPPEMVSDLPRFHIQNISVSKLAAWQIAHLICDIYNVQFTNTALSNTKIPNELRTLLVLLMDQSVHRRPTLNDILKRALFNTDEIKLLSSMDNILLQKDNERIEYMQLLRERLPGLHASIRQGRVLSCLLSVLEAVDCAETLHTLAEVLRKGQPTSLLALRTENVIVKLLTSSSSFISPNKLHQHHSNIGLQQQIGVNQASQDQQVGMGLMLLKDIEPFVAVTSHQTVQKKIFPIILSNMRSDDVNLRNYCVRAVYFLHSKLSSQNIQNEALPRLRERLSDKVPEVRANSTICLCSISSELGSDANNIVFTAISAAIRDQHPTVALAGMESLCKQLPRFPPYILAQRLLPLVPQHLVQPEKKAREAAFNVMKEVIGILQDNSSKLDNEARLENEKRRAEAIAVSHNDSGDNMFFNVGPFSLSNRISTSKQGISQLSTSKQNKNDEKKESWEDEEEIEQENWDDDTSLGKVQDSEQEQEDNNNGFPRNIFDPYPQRRNDFGTDPFRSNSPSLMSDNPEMFQMMFKRNSSFL
ncbi:MAG: putative SCY1 protein kinase [Streblomastix strix]|uniref:Putative SCY1 protein kinase n=1 Tax=Streblomastix strix TaxID=222440 RepID=A0A5J4W2S7_9EUKA|nr:MAG: putative SCY1 protein kinase [Streblomastix strix]